jgi:hypothetical protein
MSVLRLTDDDIHRMVAAHLPGRTVQAMCDHGEWVRRIVQVTLDGGEMVFIKLNTHGGEEGWLDSTAHEAAVADLLRAHGLPAPRILAVDTSRTIVPAGYIIQEHRPGRRLGDVLAGLCEEEAIAVYAALGDCYRRLHAIAGPASGVWAGGPDRVLPVSPNDFMYNAEIVGGSGRRALDEGRISRHTYDRAVALWATQMDYLKDHTASLVHVSPFLWTICLERDATGWRVTRLNAMGDIMWWDPAYDLAHLRYPPYGHVTPARWEAFAATYGPLPERRRMLLYLIMQRLCAAMGVYMAPQADDTRPWAPDPAWPATALDGLDALMDEIEGRSFLR